MVLTGNPEVPHETVCLTLTIPAQSRHPGQMVFVARSPNPCMPIFCAGMTRAMNWKAFGTRSVPATLSDELKLFSIEGNDS